MHGGNETVSLSAAKTRLEAEDRGSPFNSCKALGHILDQKLQVLRLPT